MTRHGFLIGALAIGGIALSHVALSNNSPQLVVSGSSTVAPFARYVAEQVGEQTGQQAPSVRSVGSSAGIQQMCDSAGSTSPAIATASRRIKTAEIAACRTANVDIVELKVGADGIVVAANRSSSLQSLTVRQLYLAMGHKVPGTDNKVRFNTSENWRDIDPELDNDTVRVLGPSNKHGTYGALQEMVLEAGCETFPQLAQLADSKKAFDRLNHEVYCTMFRQDGHYETFDDYEQLLQTLLDDSEAIAFLPYSLYNQHRDQLRAIAINNVAPTPAEVAAERYPLARPLYLYINRARLDSNPHVMAYLSEFTNEKAWSETGYLASIGLIALPGPEREQGKRALVQKTILGL